jgi:hypothetical protein
MVSTEAVVEREVKGPFGDEATVYVGIALDRTTSDEATDTVTCYETRDISANSTDTAAYLRPDL